MREIRGSGDHRRGGIGSSPEEGVVGLCSLGIGWEGRVMEYPGVCFRVKEPHSIGFQSRFRRPRSVAHPEVTRHRTIV